MHLVLELKVTGNEFDSNINNYETDTAARVAYYQLLAQAISSEIETHTVVLMTADGTIIEKQTFNHQVMEPNTVEINDNIVI